MSITHKLSHSLASDANGPISATYTEVGTVELQVNQSFPAATVNSLITIAFTVAGVQVSELLSDQNMTIKVNSSSSPSQTINLQANMPFIWSRSPGYFANPWVADVTAFYVSCTPAARLKVRILK